MLSNKQNKRQSAAAEKSAPVMIHNLGGKPTSKYLALSERDCKDSTDASAYREAVRLDSVITMGMVIAEPYREYRPVAVAHHRNDAPLPPDPEGMNDKRAAWGGRAIAAFEKATGVDREDALSDLLADLFHWCDRNGVDFEHELARARGHYDEETLDDETVRSSRSITRAQ